MGAAEPFKQISQEGASATVADTAFCGGRVTLLLNDLQPNPPERTSNDSS